MVEITEKGSFNNLESYLRNLERIDWASFLSKYGEIGVNALSNATPTDSGVTANSWYYQISSAPGHFTLSWHNHNIDRQGTPVAILIEYGHGTRNGGYVEAREYIMYAIRPIFDAIEKDVAAQLNKA